MGKRRAVGATIAAIILFGSLLVSNFLLVESQQQRASLFVLAGREKDSYDQGMAIGSASLLSLLDGVENAVSVESIPCSGATASLSALVGSQSVRLESPVGTATATAVVQPSGEASDNMSSLGAFAGSAPGLLDLLASFNASVGGPGSGVAFQRSEAHRLNLPMKVDALVSLCLGSATATTDALRALGAKICNSTVVERAMAGLRRELESSASALGLSLVLDYSAAAAPACGVSFSILVSQPGVPGPLGPFTWAAADSGSVFLPGANSSAAGP